MLNWRHEKRNDERFAEVLARYDESLSSAGEPPFDAQNDVPPEWLKRFRLAKPSIDALYRVWSEPDPSVEPASFSLSLDHVDESAPGAFARYRPSAPVSSGVRNPDAGLASTELGEVPVIDGFEVFEIAGKGGMGIVYRARQSLLSRDVALKVLSPKFAADKQGIERFHREADLAASLTDGNILPLYDVKFFQDRPVLVMPFIKGCDLGKILAHREKARNGERDGLHPWAGLPELDYRARVLGVLDRMADALAALDKNGIVHSDVKPSNILVDDEGKPWLCDFGLARLNTRHGSIAADLRAGSPGYMSPEQWTGVRDPDSRIDVFGLGVTAYQVMTATLPYGRDAIDKRTPLAPSPRALRRSYSADYDTVVLKAIVPNREDRYGSGRSFREDWHRVREGLPPASDTLGWRGSISRRARKFRLNLGNSLVILCLFALAAVFMRQSPSVETPKPVPKDNKRVVVVDTTPQGARVALVPIDPETGDLIPAHAIRPRDGRRTPVRLADVPAGDYLLVVEKAGRGFHEVYRHVPKWIDRRRTSDDFRVGGDIQHLAHYDWTDLKDGTVVLPAVAIPSLSESTSSTNFGMARFAGADSFRIGDTRGGVLAHEVVVNPFYIDCGEVTIAGYLDVMKGLPRALNNRRASLRPSHPMQRVSHPLAIEYAERVGKRLPTEQEFEFASTMGGSRRFPWGDRYPTNEDGSLKGWKVGDVGRADDTDQTPTDPPVFGLYSGVAEWTSSWPKPFPITDAAVASLGLKKKPSSTPVEPYAEKRVVKGGTPSVIDDLTLLAGERLFLSPRSRHDRFGDQGYPGVGFRCVRSARPRFLDSTD